MNFKLTVFNLMCVVLTATSESCKTPDNKNGECILLRQCPTVLQLTTNKTSDALDFVGKSSCGFSGVDSMVCCPIQNSNNSSNTHKNKTSNRNLLPNRRYCGYQHSDDYVHDTNTTEITEFPWLARIAYRKPSESEDSYKRMYGCVGSLINNRYILTSAVCATPPQYILQEVRLGEYHIVNDTDCVSNTKLVECSEPVRDYLVNEIIPHPLYNATLKLNDIALLRLKKKVNYSDYIRPICLPYPGTPRAKVNDTLTTSGWGAKRLDSNKTTIKKRVLGQIISNDECEEIYKQYIKDFKLTENHLCTVVPENGTDLTCIGDAGAPVIFSRRLQWHQEGIVSFGMGSCGSKGPEVLTKVRNYLDWIEENIEP